jgi:hypothetical protein
MAIYRFKVQLEENEDISRDIEIKASQTFEDLHQSIQEAFKFDAKHAASFFVSDDYWRKGQEITLRKEDLPLDEEEQRNNVDPKKLMKEAKIASFIEAPHQRFVYVFDPNVQWTFHIEMIRIAEETRKTMYPAIVKSVGAAPKQYRQVVVPKEDVDDPETALAALVGEEEEEEEGDDGLGVDLPAEVEAVEDEDISALEGEEGEEEDLIGDDGAEPSFGEEPEEN